MKLLRYTPDMRPTWDTAVEESRNGTLLFRRSYMDYHQDRFADTSLMWTDERGIVSGMLPACRDPHDKHTITSHAGLTYGGFILMPRTTLVMVGEMLRSAMKMFAEMGAQRLVIKPIPYIYSTLPCQEELYWIYRLRGTLQARSASQAIALQRDGWTFSTLRRRAMKRALRSGIHLSESAERLAAFWQLLDETLTRHHGVHPVHTYDEIEALVTDNAPHIRLYTAELNNHVVAGTLVYESGKVAHTQYLATDDTGRATGALDLLIHYVTDHYKTIGYEWLDFGISTEQGGTILNEGLTFQKEGFGGRTVCYDNYILPLDTSISDITP